MAPISKWVKGLLEPIYEKWHETGRQEGLEWARGRATPAELLYAATAFRTQMERGKLVSYNPAKDKVIGSVFEEAFERHRFSWEETEPYARIPDIKYQQWEQGFADAVREYWETDKA